MPALAGGNNVEVSRERQSRVSQLTDGLSQPVKVWVVFRDKGEMADPGQVGAAAPASPAHARAYEDTPLHAPYLEGLQSLGFRHDITLKWQNRVSGFIAANRLEALRRAPGVKSVERMPKRRKVNRWRGPIPHEVLAGGLARGLAYGLKKGAASQVDSSFGVLQATLEGIGGQALRDSLAARGLKPGAGIRIAILDSDFDLGNDIFSSLFTEERLRDQYDFVADSDASVTRLLADSHGAQVLSIIGGDAQGRLQGAAPAAEYMLYRTEDAFNEGFVEEDYLAAAMERAVDSGAHVVNISLGYRYEFDNEDDVPFSAMDGKTRPSSIAVAKAAQRNVLVTVSVGNMPGFASLDGTPTLQAPADADGILAVGITDLSGVPCGYSCTGPSFDGRIKPDIMGLGPNSCAVPVASPIRASGTTFQSGTSFAAPALAGIAALLRQAFPDATALEVREALVRTAALGTQPTNASGYGLAQADRAWLFLAGDTAGALRPQPGAPEKPKAYGPKRLVYGDRDTPWSFTWVPDLQTPSAVYDLRGRSIGVDAKPFGAVLEVRPKKPIAQGIYLLP